MRKLIVIAAMILVSASAQAGQRRGLSLASADEPTALTAQAQPVDDVKASETNRSVEVTTAAGAAKPADAPKFVERPTIDTTPAPTAATPPAKADTAKSCASQTAKADKPRRRSREWTETRIIGELHRHGIYW